MFRILIILLFFTGFSAHAQNTNYHLTYSEGNEFITLRIYFPSTPAEQIRLIIPRSAPGTYEITNYSAFITDVTAFSENGRSFPGKAGDGSYYSFEANNRPINRIRYRVNITKMERELLGGYASSKIRKNYLGILGYSVFGFIEGFENFPVTLHVIVPETWPVFSTLNPGVERKTGSATYRALNYTELADAQYLFGKDVKILEVKDAPIPLFVACYSETAVETEVLGKSVLKAIKALQTYFGYLPMPHYSVCYEFLKPISPLHEYGFNMEHLNSMTASMDVLKATKINPENIGSIVHHIGHAWIPLRAYGTGYRPFEWQVAPLIDTIWLNEGFIWYVTYIEILKDPSKLAFFKKVLADAPDFIAKKSLRELSLLGSTQYSLDFRIGKNLFARGALMAVEMNEKIEKETRGKKRFKDALLGLLEWSKTNKRAFRYNEIEPILSKAVGVNLKPVWEKWQKPLR